MKIALVGNPNSGKTTLFNEITGRIEYVGNWPGVTIEKKEGKIKNKYTNGKQISVIDLPGSYSMNSFTKEEVITKEYIENGDFDCIINIVDSTSLNRSLLFTTQILELGVPVVVALNKVDLLYGEKYDIDTEGLSLSLGCPVVDVSAIKSKGLTNLVDSCYNIKKFNGVPLNKLGLPNHSSESERFNFIENTLTRLEINSNELNVINVSDKIDKIVTNKWLGIPIFMVIVWLIFFISQELVGPVVQEYLVGFLEGLQGNVAEMFEGGNEILTALLIDGIIGGVIAVVGFLPLIMIMLFLMALLEDSGYMSRIAIVMDKFFSKIGLSGKSIIPMIIGTACSVPGVMATRTIKDDRQRKTTAIITPFMPCGAKLPIIALFAGIFYNGNSFIGTSMYFLGIAVIILSAIIVRKITGDKSKSNFFMELPNYRIPSFKRASIFTLSRGKMFIIKAGTIIMICNVVVHMMITFTPLLEIANEDASNSILSVIASPFAILFIPLGFGVWQFAAAAVTGFIAKENVVATLAVCFAISNFINVEDFEMIEGSATNIKEIFGITGIAGMSYLLFNLFTPPCFAAIGAVKAEVNSKVWTFAAIGFQLAMGYVIAFMFYQIGTILTYGELGEGFIPGLIIVILICTYICYLMFKGTSEKEVLEV